MSAKTKDFVDGAAYDIEVIRSAMIHVRDSNEGPKGSCCLLFSCEFALR